MSPPSNEDIANRENAPNPSGQFEREASTDRGEFGSGARRYFDSRDRFDHDYYNRSRGFGPERERRGSVSDVQLDFEGEGPYGSYRGTYGRHIGSLEPLDGSRREEYHGHGRSDRSGWPWSSDGYSRSQSPFRGSHDYSQDGRYGFGDYDKYGYRRDYYGRGYGSENYFGRRDHLGGLPYGYYSRGFGDYSDRYGYSGRPYRFGGKRYGFEGDHGRYDYGGVYGRYGYGDDLRQYGHGYGSDYGRYGYRGDYDKYGYSDDYGRYGYGRYGRYDSSFDRDFDRYGYRTDLARYGYESDRRKYPIGSSYDEYGVEGDSGRYGYGYNFPRSYGRRDYSRYGRGLFGDFSHQSYYRDQSPYGHGSRFGGQDYYRDQSPYGYGGRFDVQDYYRDNSPYGYGSRFGGQDKSSYGRYGQDFDEYGYRRNPYESGLHYPSNRQGYDRYYRPQGFFPNYGQFDRFPWDRHRYGGPYGQNIWDYNRHGFQGYKSPYNYNAGPLEYQSPYFGGSGYPQPFPKFSQQPSYRN